MLNAAMVGLGWWGRHMVKTMADSGKLRFVALAAGNPDRHRDFAAEMGITLHDGLDGALADPAVDTVVLCTPHSQHEDQVLAAIRAGKRVFCEKPLALTKVSAQRIVAAAEAAGFPLGIGHERRFEPSMEEIARLAASGDMGVMMHAEANFSHDLLVGLDPNNWRASPQEGPSVAMTGMGVHLTDLFIAMLGPVAAVCATRADRVLGFPTGDIVTVSLRFASGATGFISGVLATPYYGRLTLMGERMWVEARDTAHPQHGGETHVTVCGKDGKQHTRTLAGRDPVRANLEEWADAVMGRGTYRFSHEQILNNAAVLEAVGLSAERGEWIFL